MSEEEKQALSSIVSSNTTLIQQSFDKLTVDIKNNNNHLNNIKETDGLKLNIETYQNRNDDKIKNAEKSIDKMKEAYKL